MTPKTFEEFRKQVAAALEACGAPSDLCDEVADVGYEGEGSPQELYRAWDYIYHELKDPEVQKEIAREGFGAWFSTDIYDCVVNIVADSEWCKIEGNELEDLAAGVTAYMKQTNGKGRTEVSRETKTLRGQDPAERVARAIAHAIEIEESGGAPKVRKQGSHSAQTDGMSCWIVILPPEEDMMETRGIVAEYVINEMCAQNAASKYGYKFERPQDHDDEAVYDCDKFMIAAMFDDPGITVTYVAHNAV